MGPGNYVDHDHDTCRYSHCRYFLLLAKDVGTLIDNNKGRKEEAESNSSNAEECCILFFLDQILDDLPLQLFHWIVFLLGSQLFRHAVSSLMQVYQTTKTS